MKYEVEGTITIDVMLDVIADDEKSAILLAENSLKERYNLDVNGSYHNPDKDVKFDLDAFNPADYEG